MRASLRNVEHIGLVGAQLHVKPSAKALRVWPQIDQDVEDRASRAANDLGFGVRFGLKMQPAERAATGVEGGGALDETRLQTGFREFFGAKGPQEMATLVCPRHGLDEPSAGDVEGRETEIIARRGQRGFPLFG